MRRVDGLEDHESSLCERASIAERGPPTLLFEEDDMAEDHVERRRYLRVGVYLDTLEVNVGLPGLEPIKGVVLDISRGGMKVCLEHEIPKPLLGYDCLVRFVEDPQDRVNVEAKPGKLLRMEVAGQYAIKFDSPLEVLNMGSDPETVEAESGATSDADG